MAAGAPSLPIVSVSDDRIDDATAEFLLSQTLLTMQQQQEEAREQAEEEAAAGGRGREGWVAPLGANEPDTCAQGGTYAKMVVCAVCLCGTT